MGMRLTNDRVLKLSHGKENMLDRVGGQFCLVVRYLQWGWHYHSWCTYLHLFRVSFSTEAMHNIGPASSVVWSLIEECWSAITLFSFLFSGKCVCLLRMWLLTLYKPLNTWLLSHIILHDVFLYKIIIPYAYH